MLKLRYKASRCVNCVDVLSVEAHAVCTNAVVFHTTDAIPYVALLHGNESLDMLQSALQSEDTFIYDKVGYRIARTSVLRSPVNVTVKSYSGFPTLGELIGANKEALLAEEKSLFEAGRLG